MENGNKLIQRLHILHGKYIKSIIYGGLDGIVTTFAVVAGASGAALDPGIILILGCANLFADGCSMGFGDFMSSRAEHEYYEAEKTEAGKIYDQDSAHLYASVAMFYLNQGFSKEDAESA